MFRTFAILLSAAVFAAVCAATAYAAEPSASGTLTVNGTTTRVAYAYAREVPSFFENGRNDLEIIVSDVPLDANAQRHAATRMEMAKAGKLHAFEMTLNPAGKPISTSWRHRGFKDASPSGLSSSDVFVAKTIDKQVVDASYKAAKPQSFFGHAYDFDLSFRASIVR